MKLMRLRRNAGPLRRDGLEVRKGRAGLGTRLNGMKEGGRCATGKQNKEIGRLGSITTKHLRQEPLSLERAEILQHSRLNNDFFIAGVVFQNGSEPTEQDESIRRRQIKR